MPTNSKHGCSGDAAAVTFLYCLMGESGLPLIVPEIAVTRQIGGKFHILYELIAVTNFIAG